MRTHTLTLSLITYLSALFSSPAAQYLRIEFYDATNSIYGSVIMGEIEVMRGGVNVLRGVLPSSSGGDNLDRLTDGVTENNFSDCCYWNFYEAGGYSWNFNSQESTLGRLARYTLVPPDVYARVAPSRADPHWIQYNLGSDVEIDYVRIHLGPNDRTYTFAVFVGDSPGQWRKVSEFENVTGVVNVGVGRPEVSILSAQMRPGTSLMDVVFRVNDLDSQTVKIRALAFQDGERSFSKVIRPVTFVEGTSSLIGGNIAANTNHTLTWDVGTDWPVQLGFVKFEVLAQDDRGLLPLEWITIPATTNSPLLTISKNTPTDADVFSALCWLYADGYSGLLVTNGLLKSTSPGFVYNYYGLVDGSTVLDFAAPFVYRAMNLAVADSLDVALAKSARVVVDEGWLAVNKPYDGLNVVVGWGDNGSGQAGSREGFSGVLAVAAGGSHSLALQSDGTVVGWGNWPESTPEGLTDVVLIAAGNDHSLALKNDGTVVGWGYNWSGRATPPAGLTGVVSISAGGSHSLALKSDGTVVGWGNNGNGQTTPPEGLTGVVAIAAGDYHSLALKSDGTVVGWGQNWSGHATPPAGLTGVVSISAGGSHSLALKSDGTVVGWGNNGNGQTTPPEGLTGVVAIAAGGQHSLALKSDGTVVGWGYDGYQSFDRAKPPPGLPKVVAIAAGEAHSLVIIEQND